MRTFMLLLPLCLSVTNAHAADVFALETSKYWCDILRGSYDGRVCRATYRKSAAGGACDLFSRTVTDPALRQQLQRIRSTPRCIGEVTDESKLNTIKLRVKLRGFVTAGQNEEVNDPTTLSFVMPREGRASFLAAAEYLLHECVVESCMN